MLGGVRQQAITWTNVDLDPCRHMASLGHNELTNLHQVMQHQVAISLLYKTPYRKVLENLNDMRSVLQFAMCFGGWRSLLLHICVE